MGLILPSSPLCTLEHSNQQFKAFVASFVVFGAAALIAALVYHPGASPDTTLGSPCDASDPTASCSPSGVRRQLGAESEGPVVHSHSGRPEQEGDAEKDGAKRDLSTSVTVSLG